MSFSLLSQPWIPIVRRGGIAERIRPSDLTSQIETDPVVALTWPRPDFRLACLEFLIGLLATACPPAEDDGIDEPGDWLAGWNRPPTPAQLADAFAPFASAFILDGDGPRFMQDREDIAGEVNRIETLLINAPGGQTLKKNTDHFVKRDTVAAMGRATAAMALFTLQCFAPAGGAGNRVGLRGGGPLTTLAIPPWPHDRPLPLWHLLWANVPVGVPPALPELPMVFPWLAPTRTSETAGRTTSPGAGAHELQAFWGMARRIRLDFAANPEARPCGLDGLTDTTVVCGWRQKPYGANYAAWQHPLSPYYRQKPTDVPLPVHAQPGGIGFRHWIGLLFEDAGGLRAPAAAITTFRARRWLSVSEDGARPWQLLAAGYDMDNMKARGFTESEMPIIEPVDRARAAAVDDLLRTMINGASEIATFLGRAVRRALFSDAAKLALDAGLLADLRERFWEVADGPFQRRLHEAALTTAEPETLRRGWLRDLAQAARRLFDETAPIDASTRRPDRVAAAARGLDLALGGRGKDGEALFKTLRLPLPEATTKVPKPPKNRSKAA